MQVLPIYNNFIELNPRAGFVLAPILYVISILAVLGTVFFTGYIQTVRSYSEVTSTNSVRNELQLSSEILASRSTQDAGSPPVLTTPTAITLPLATDTDYKRLPKTPASTVLSAAFLNPAGTGSATSAGTVPANMGIKRIDPWGRLFLYCQWNNQQSPGTDSSFSVISAGSDGKLETTCMNSAVVTGSDDRMQYLTVASAMARSRSWQAQADNTYRFGVDATSATAGRVVVGVSTAQDTDTTQQLNVGGNGKFGGNLTVTGNLATTYVSAAMVNASGVANSGDQSVGGNQTIGGTIGVTGNATLGGNLNVSGMIANPSALNGGNVVVNDAIYAFGSSGSGNAVKVLGSGTSSQPELAAYAAAGNIPIRLTSQGTGNVIFRTNNVDRMVVDGSGNVGIGTTNPQKTLDVNGGLQALIILNLSDRRLKDKIAPIDDPLAQVRKLRGVRFIWKRDGTASVGVIAQEVEQVFPELVQTGADGIKAVMYANLVSPLIEAVKALADKFDEVTAWQHSADTTMAQMQAHILQLRADNTALQARLEKLEAKRR